MFVVFFWSNTAFCTFWVADPCPNPTARVTWKKHNLGCTDNTPVEKEKPNFALSGALTEDTSTYQGVEGTTNPLRLAFRNQGGGSTHSKVIKPCEHVNIKKIGHLENGWLYPHCPTALFQTGSFPVQVYLSSEIYTFSLMSELWF